MPRIIRFACYEVDLAGGQIYKRGARLRLPDQPFRVLASLLEHPGRAVTREELRRRLWPDQAFLDFDNLLNSAVARLREALHDAAQNPRFIETLPKRGYRFIASVSEVKPDGDAPFDGRPSRPSEADRIGQYDPVAYHEYVQGLRFLNIIGSRSHGEKSRAHFDRAIARDPSFALAYEGLAQLSFVQAYIGLVPPRDAIAAGILHATRAIEFDETRAEARGLLAHFSKQLDYNWPEIERELSRVRQLASRSPFAKLLYAIGWLMPQGHIDDAIAEVGRAVELDPVSVMAHTWLGILMGLARRWEDAIDQGRLIAELTPVSPMGSWILSIGLRGTGRYDEAIAAARKAVDLSDGTGMLLGSLGLLLGVSGRKGEALAILERLESDSQDRYVPPTSFAWVYLGLRAVDRAFEWLNVAVERRDQQLMPIKSYAFLDPIRADPRFAALLVKMRLNP